MRDSNSVYESRTKGRQQGGGSFTTEAPWGVGRSFLRGIVSKPDSGMSLMPIKKVLFLLAPVRMGSTEPEAPV